MALCQILTIDSNRTGLFFAEEECYKELVSPESDVVWRGLEPNSYSDFGGDITTVSRQPINPSRQDKKGTITDLNASGGFNTDVTQNNLTRLLQGFFFADAREPMSTKPLNGTEILITGVSGTNSYTAASGLDGFSVGDLVLVTGFGIPDNNGLKQVTTVVAGELTVAETLIAEASPPSTAKIAKVGFEFDSGDIAMSAIGGAVALTSTTTDFTTFADLTPGTWIFLGGDAVGDTFVNNRGYARISEVDTNTLVLDDTEFSAVSEAATGLSIRVFIGTTVRNEADPALVKTKSFQFKRTLGDNLTTGDLQAEYLEGAVANELKLNIPTAEKMTADLTYVGADNTQRSGEPGDLVKEGTRLPSLAEAAFNTTQSVRRIKMNVLDPANSNPTGLFAFLTEVTLTMNNGVTANKAVGVLGAINTTAANFMVSGSATAYFSGVESQKSIRNNADVSVNMIVAADNSGHVWDVPLLTLGGGRLNVEKDAPITIPLDIKGAENKFGFTASHTNFPYLPDAAVPQ